MSLDVLMAVVVGWLYACAVFLILRRSVLHLVIGLVLLTSAANLLIFTAANLTRAQPAIAAVGAMQPAAGYADPLPQALILTAIVIGFGTLAFTFVLVYRAYKTVGTDDLDDLTRTDT